MAQQIINTGAVANDGTGDPLRTAFTETNNNFTEIYTAGPVDSNVRITDNTILTINTNGNLVLAPNGTGVVQSNVNIVPNQANVRNLGSSTRRWSTLYLQYADISSTVTIGGGLTVGGNLTVSGNIIQVGNIITDSLTIQLGNTAANAAAANGAGITVGANDNIATVLYNSTSNVWTTNIGLSAVGNISAPYFIGNGSLLTGLAAYGNANVATFLAAYGSNTIVTTGNVSGGYFIGNGSTLTNIAGANVSGTVANATYATTAGSATTAGTVTTAAQGNITSVGVLTSLSATGNVTADYFIGNAAALIGLNSAGEHAANLGVSGWTELNSNVVVQVTGNANSYAQINFQNISNGTHATTDYIATAQSGNDSTYFVDMGIASGNYDATDANNSLGNSLYPQDSYLYAMGGNSVGGFGGNLVVGSNEPGGVVRVIANGSTVDNIVATFSNVGMAINGDINFNGGGITQTINEDLNIVVQDEEDDGWSLYNTITDSLGNNLSQTQLDSSSFTIRTDMTGGDYQWQFDGNTLQVSKDSIVRGYESNVVVQSMSGANAVMASLQSVSNVNDPNVFSTFDATTTSANIKVYNGGSNGGIEYAWKFDNSGNLTLPRGGIVYETNIPSGGLEGNTIALKPSGGSNADQQLLVYPTAGADFNHLHLTSGNLYSTELFLGNDNLYVKLANTGNIVINSNDDVGNSAQWLFGTTGNLTLPGNTFAVNYANGTAVSLGGNYGNANVATFLAAYGSNTISTSGNVTAGNLIGNISITGNVTGTSSNVTLVAGAYSWTFDNTGNLQGNLSLTGGNITINNSPGGNEGAEIKWALPGAANTVLSGTLVQDVFQNGMRFFESGGNSRGLYMDLGNVPNGAGTAVGYRDIPQVSFTGNATLEATDAGRHYYSTLATANTLTIANNTSVSWTVGTAISVVNRGSGNITIAQGSGVSLYLAGNSTAANRTISTYGMATLLNVAANVWMINGTGVS